MKTLLNILLLLSFSFSVQAQKLAGVGTLIQGGVEDGEKLISAYMRPLNQALIVGLHNSNFNGAYDSDDQHTFALSLNISFVNIPNKYKTFDINDLGLESLEARDPKETIAQTVFGDSSTIKLNSVYGFGITGIRLFSLNTLNGSEKTMIPLPLLNATYRIGGVTISGQVVPPVTLPDTDIRAWLIGGGLQIDLAEFVGTLDDWPLDFFVSGGYYFLGAHSDLTIIPGHVVVNLPLTDDRKGPYDNQELVFNYSGFQTSIYASTKLNIFTPFIGMGFDFGTSNVNLKGTFPVYAKGKNNFFGVRASDVENPFSDATSYSRVKFEGGGRFDFGRFFGQASYTLANFGGLNGSLGIRF